MKRRYFAYPYVVWMIVFTVLPMLLVLYYALTNAPTDSSFTLKHVLKFIDPVYIKVLWRSLYMAFLCTVICFLIGYPAAYILARSNMKPMWVMLFILPMWINLLLRTYAWMSLLENTGIINNVLEALGFGRTQLLYNARAVLLGMVYNFLPFMILPVYTVLNKMDHSLLEAAADLGANQRLIFLRVILPLSIPGIMSGIIMVFMPAVTTFVISRLLGGSQFMLFGDLIEQQFLQSGNWNFGSLLSVIMMAIILLTMAALTKSGGTDSERNAIL